MWTAVKAYSLKESIKQMEQRKIQQQKISNKKNSRRNKYKKEELRNRQKKEDLKKINMHWKNIRYKEKEKTQI